DVHDEVVDRLRKGAELRGLLDLDPEEERVLDELRLARHPLGGVLDVLGELHVCVGDRRLREELVRRGDLALPLLGELRDAVGVDRVMHTLLAVAEQVLLSGSELCGAESAIRRASSMRSSSSVFLRKEKMLTGWPRKSVGAPPSGAKKSIAMGSKSGFEGRTRARLSCHPPTPSVMTTVCPASKRSFALPVPATASGCMEPCSITLVRKATASSNSGVSNRWTSSPPSSRKVAGRAYIS